MAAPVFKTFRQNKEHNVSLKNFMFLAAVVLGGQAAQADQLCQSDGTGCMNITWDCGSFAVSPDLMCLETSVIAPMNIKEGALQQVNSGDHVDVPKDVEATRRKPKKSVILPDPKVQKSAGCPPICLEKPVLLPEEPIE